MKKFSLTKLGSVILGVGGFLSTMPQDATLGTYHGAQVTIGHISAAVGFVITMFGLRNAIGKNK